MAILTDALKESYLKNAVCDIPEYKFALKRIPDLKSFVSSSSKPI
jgi:hypothetical protein